MPADDDCTDGHDRSGHGTPDGSCGDPARREGSHGRPAPGKGSQGDPVPREGSHAPAASAWPLSDALVGLVAAVVVPYVVVAVWSSVTPRPKAAGGTSVPLSVPEQMAALAAIWVALVATVVVASRRRRSRRFARDLGLRLRPWPDLPVGLACGIGGQIVVAGLYWPWERIFPGLERALDREQAAGQLASTTHGGTYVLVAAAVVVGAPFVEELFFRGLLLRTVLLHLGIRMPRHGGAAAVGITAVVFALFHFEPLALPGLAVAGGVFGMLALRTGRLGPAMLAHAGFNASALVVIGGALR